MASASQSAQEGDQTVPEAGEETEPTVQSIQSHYLRCPSPSNFSMVSESRFSMISGSDAESIFMEPIHLSSAIAAKQIINEELKPRGIKTESIPESMLETAEQLMVEDLYNRVKDMIDDRSPWNTPCVMDIQRAMVQDRLESPMNAVDEVWPNIFIGEKSVAVNKARLKRMGITHILNSAHGTGVYTGQSFYTGMSLQYMGIEVDDFADADISPHFRTAAEFLDEALLTHKGKVLVDSMMGVSRSAVLVAAYLMIFHHMTIMEALTALRKKRAINPNEGFLKQLRQLNEDLMEERDEDDDETLSQSSVIDMRARVFGDDEDDDEDEEESMIGVKAQSIMMEEEEDGSSVMSSVASSAATAALRSGSLGARGRAGPPEPADGQPVAALPGPEGGDEGDEDGDDVSSVIREWQKRNEKYQSDGWWEAQLNSDDEEEGGLLPGGGGRPGTGDGGEEGDLESVTSEEVRAVKERVKRRGRRAPSDSVSTASCSSYSDLWKQRLKEIEEQAAARYRKKEDDEGSESTEGGGGGGGGGGKGKKSIEDDMKSVMSDTSSMYNFCQRNKQNLTPLERWRVKRIQFGWNKNDREGGENGAGGAPGEGGGEPGEAEARTPSLEDVNLTAYQTWKMKQQKRYGGEENANDVLEMSRGEDSATARRRQRREELLERSKKTLEESQSMCGWETESVLSGSTVPLSAFWAGAGVTAPPSVANDDAMSMLSGRSSVLSQARSARSQSLGPPPAVPQVPIVPTTPGPGGEPMVNLASIQNWIASVVTETLIQKQGEMSLPPPSRAGSLLSFGGGASVLSGRGLDDDKASMLSGASYSSNALSRGGLGAGGKAESVLSSACSSRAASSSFSSVSGLAAGLGSRKNKITTTSVPLCSLFQDQVDLKKLDSMDKEMKSEMRDKMASYERKKITEDNKRSTLYKKKKPKDEEDEEEEQEKSGGREEYLKEITKKEKPTRSYGLSGRLNLNTTLEKEKNTSIDDWLQSVRPPQRKPASYDAEDDDLDVSASECDFSSRRASYAAVEEEEEEEEYGVASRYGSRFRADPPGRDDSPEPRLGSLRSPLVTGRSSGLTDTGGYGRATGRSYGAREESEEAEDNGAAKRKYAHHSRCQSAETEGGRARKEEEEEEEDDVAAFIRQTRQRIRARAAAEAEDDEVLSAWKAQQESKSSSSKGGEC
ncbi:LOW QUALITY PROTEIN: serine/threonine/tyrosine-interacting-like protein 2 [Aplochiton taeniatus]